jgi:GNAT superfamily N-acetyltransferase
MMLRVTTAEEIKTVAALAREIWNAHFVPIIGQAQVDYMLEHIQSAGAIAGQIAAGHEYYLVLADRQNVGYCALVPCLEEARVQLSKLYLLEQQRGRGLGKAVVECVEERCRKLGARELWLTVNRHNAGPIGFYGHAGFVNAGTTVQDIGGGFVMDDYKMVKAIG